MSREADPAARSADRAVPRRLPHRAPARSWAWVWSIWRSMCLSDRLPWKLLRSDSLDESRARERFLRGEALARSSPKLGRHP